MECENNNINNPSINNNNNNNNNNVSTIEYFKSNEVNEILKNYGVGIRQSDDCFFQAGNLFAPAKFVKLGIEKYNGENVGTADSYKYSLQNKCESVICNVPSCRKEFNTISEYNSHYKVLHQYGCHVCKRNIPSAHLLDLHLSEMHDSFFAIQATKMPMYQCFLPDCTHKSLTIDERKTHCIETHNFSRKFRFDTYKRKTSKDISKNIGIGGGGATSKISTDVKMSEDSNSGPESMGSADSNITDDDKRMYSSKLRPIIASAQQNTASADSNGKICPSKLKYFNFGHSHSRTFQTTSKKKQSKNQNNNNNNNNGNQQTTTVSLETMSVDLLEHLPQ